MQDQFRAFQGLPTPANAFALDFENTHGREAELRRVREEIGLVHDREQIRVGIRLVQREVRIEIRLQHVGDGLRRVAPLVLGCD